MANDRDKEELVALIGETKDQLRAIVEIQRARADLVGTGSALRNRVTVTVNADGTVIETKFGAGIEDLSYSEIARAVTEAAQKAAKDLADRHRTLVEPLESRRARMPKLADLIEDMPDLNLPEASKPSLAPPYSRDRAVPFDVGEPRFADAEEYPSKPEGRIIDSGW